MARDFGQGSSKWNGSDGGFKRELGGDSFWNRRDMGLDQEEWRGTRGQREDWGADDLRHELQSKERMRRDWADGKFQEHNRAGGDRFGREGEQNKRRLIEDKGVNFGQDKMEEQKRAGNL